jgi:hypothetical protein
LTWSGSATLNGQSKKKKKKKKKRCFGPWGDSATPRAIGVVRPPPKLALGWLSNPYIYLFILKKKSQIIYMGQPQVAILIVPRVADRNLLVLDEKIDGGTISVFSHNKSTI